MEQVMGVNTDTLRTQISQMRTELDAINRNMDSMYDSVERLDRMWDGPANQAFRMQFIKDKEDLMEISNLIRDLIESMDYSDGEYINAETEIRSIISGIRV